MIKTENYPSVNYEIQSTGYHSNLEQENTIREDVFLEECDFQDPALREFAREHAAELSAGDINPELLDKTKGSNGWAYKILLHEGDQQPPLLTGAVFANRAGVDSGAIQISYVLAKEYEGQGIATAAVGEASSILARKYDVVARISPENKRSVALINKLGFYAQEAAGWDKTDPYLKYKTHPSKLPRHESQNL